MKKALDDEVVDYKAKGEEVKDDKSWISKVPYTERGGSSRLRGLSNGSQWGNRVVKTPKKSIESNLVDACVVSTTTLLKYFHHIEQAAVDVSTYVFTLGLVKENLSKISAEQVATNAQEPVDKESLLFLKLILRRYEKFLCPLVSSRPHLIITSRYRRRTIGQFNALARMESKKAAEKNDIFLSSADLKELQQQALNLINDSEGRTLWSKLGISDLGICPWDTFFRTYVREDELVLQRLVTFGGVDHVTPHDFNLFLEAFGPLSASAKNAKSMWYRPGFYAFCAHADVYRWLVLEPVGTYVICLSLKPGYHFELHVVKDGGKIESWQIRSENSKGYHAIPFVSDLKLIDKISPFLPLDLAGSKKSRGSKDGQDEVRSSRSNSKRIDDIRKSKRSGRASQSIRREKTDSEVELGNVPPPERLRDSKSAENTTSDSKDSEEKGKAHEEGVPTVEVKHYGATVGIETFFETLNALVSHAKGTTAFISDCFSRDWFLGDISVDEVSAIMAASPVGTWIMGYDEMGKPKDSLRISHKTLTGTQHIIMTYGKDGYGVLSGLQNASAIKIKRQSMTTREKSRGRRDAEGTTDRVRGKSKEDKSKTISGEDLNEFLFSHRELLRYNYNFEHVPTLAITHQQVQILPSFTELVGPAKLTEGILFVHEMISAETVSGYPKKTKGMWEDRKINQGEVQFCVIASTPRAAAEKASKAMVEYMSDALLQMEMKTSVECQQQLMRAFRVAHDKIIEGTPNDEIWTLGQTTLIGGMLLPTAGLFEEAEWMVVFVCIGDCKLLLWNETRGTVDVTLGNRVNARSASDSGGRLGPYVETGHADLRNLRAYFSPCKLGDYLIVVTDGVYDNFDPELWGLQPENLDMGFLKSGTWEEMTPEDVSEVKDYFACTKIDSLFRECKKKTPYDFTRALVQHGMRLTHNSRSWMEEHPNDPEPSDYTKYPGKMDHITAVTMRVGCILSGEEKSKKKAKAHHPLKRSKKPSKEPVPEENVFVVLKRSVKNSIPKLPLKKYPSDLSTTVLFAGPRDQNITKLYNSNAAGFTLSTLPEDVKYGLSEMWTLEVAPHRVIAALSKACKYELEGASKKINATQVVGDSFVSYAVKNSVDIRDTHQAAELVVDALRASHENLIAKSATENFHEIDNVEIFGGIMLRLSDEYGTKTGREWAFVAANLGDSKAFHWDAAKNSLTDITPATSATDVSRLGPGCASSTDPYLMDAKLVCYPCVENGIIILLSGGVLNNLDPFYLGQAKETHTLSMKEKETKITTHRLSVLLPLLQECEPKTVEGYTQRIMNHVKSVTEAQLKYVARNGHLPEKRGKYPGFLGHCSCVVFRVGAITDAEGIADPNSMVTSGGDLATPKTETTTTTNGEGEHDNGESVKPSITISLNSARTKEGSGKGSKSPADSP